jgi:Ribosomal protein L7/L12 C-terminal domain
MGWQKMLGLTLGECMKLVDSAPVMIARGISLEDAEILKRELETGLFTEGQPHPAAGQKCCEVEVIERSGVA